jgi:two-component system cell cycle response regulator
MNGPDIPQINDEIARKFERIEADISFAGGVAEIFERLLAEIETEFGVPFVWLSVIRRPETEVFLKLLDESDFLCDRLNVIDPALFLEIIPDDARALLANGDLKPFFRLMPPNRKYFIRSLAISPLTLHGRLIGSINHGDASPERYRQEMDTTLLNHLALSVSERLAHLLPSEGM